jgi:DNA-binding MarR family transcriptional regulator
MRTTYSAGIRRDATRVRQAVTALASRARIERGGVLSLNQTAVLGRLVTNGAMTPGEMSGQLHTQPQSLTRTFAALEGAGYVRRMPDPTDGRQYLLAITPAGTRALKQEMAPRDAWVAHAISTVLTASERDLLVRASDLMRRLADFEPGGAVIER